MLNYSKEELDDALLTISSIIGRCEKMQPKFAEGSSQHTLLKNRIKALYISKNLLTGDAVEDSYSKEELREALRPVSSIISKCEKAKLKSPEGSASYIRLQKTINAMSISKALILENQVQLERSL